MHASKDRVTHTLRLSVVHGVWIACMQVCSNGYGNAEAKGYGAGTL